MCYTCRMNGSGNLDAFFRGHWHFTREVRLGDGTLSALAPGRAVFTSGDVGDVLEYHEEGRVRLLPAGTELPFSRSYRYRFEDALLHVFFADGPDAGSLYQSYDCPEGAVILRLRALHHCGADVYAGQYELDSADRFCLRTSVQGPKKDFSIVTVYERV